MRYESGHSGNYVAIHLQFVCGILMSCSNLVQSHWWAILLKLGSTPFSDSQREIMGHISHISNKHPADILRQNQPALFFSDGRIVSNGRRGQIFLRTAKWIWSKRGEHKKQNKWLKNVPEFWRRRGDIISAQKSDIVRIPPRLGEFRFIPFLGGFWIWAQVLPATR